ncbi:Major sperm protein [Meloidogyne graminicola]|uniref:Major sperm protein n=1 Tax=Meloidogyne graminicola TaxID=189291 RepID=A0A8S9ZU33_9BILA|nr:Major sperm protein [Meloidogyne graminicola]
MAAIPPADIIALPSENIFSSTGRHQTIYFHIKNTGPRRIFFSITTTSTKAIFKPNNGLINGHGEVILEVNCTGYFVGEEKEAFMVHWSNEAEDSTLAAHKATGFHRRKQMFLIYNPPKDFYFNAPFHNQQTYYTRV